MVRDGSRSIVRQLGLAIRDYRDLWGELLQHRYFRNLRQFDWHSIKLGQIIVASALINLLELASPLYISIVYTTILPKRATESLILLTFLVVACLLGAGWLKSVRLALVGREGAQVEHQKRMQAFLRHPNQVLSRQAIFHAVWGQSWSGKDNLLDVYVRYLRKKIEKDGQPQLLQTVKGVGYILKLPDP